DLAATLEEYGVAPDAVAPADPLARADNTEAAALVQHQRGAVLREDRGLDHPDSGSLGARDQRLEQRAPDAEPARLARDVDAVLDHTRVTAPRRRRRECRPPDDLAATLGA